MHLVSRAPGQPNGTHGFLLSAAIGAGDARDRHTDIGPGFRQRPVQHLPHHGFTDGAFGFQCLLVDPQHRVLDRVGVGDKARLKDGGGAGLGGHHGGD